MEEEQPNQMADDKMIHPSMNQQITVYQRKLDRIKQLKDTLTDASITQVEWNDGVAEVDRLSGEIEEILNQISKLNQKKKKKRKSKPKGTFKIISREKLHKEIDKWRQQMHEKLIKDKEFEDNKRILQKFLIDNSRRIQEAVELITKLQKAVESQGKRQSEGNPEIVRKLQQLIAVWQDTLLEYKEERCELERKLCVNKENDSEMLWRDCLFGDRSSSWIANSSLTEFINIRTAWDQFLSSDWDASPIPFFWVLPTPSPTCSGDNLWKDYRV